MNRRAVIALKVAIWGACLAPVGRLIYRGAGGGLGANPIEFITLSTGIWTLTFLTATLSITPLRKITRLAWLIKFRRLIGLFAFFYAVLHFLTYIWLDKFFDVHDMIKDIAKRPFITMGFAAFVLLIPLAATSTSGAIRRLGGRTWRWVHRLIYLSATFAVVHFWWKVKADIRKPAIYGSVLACLFMARIAIRLTAYAAERPRRLTNHKRKGGTADTAGSLST